MADILALRHPRGILLQLSCESDKNSTWLRGQLKGIAATPSLRGNYIVPNHLAYKVLDRLGSDALTWDPNLLTLATRQSMEQQAHLRALVEVDYAVVNAREVLADYSNIERLDPHQAEAVAAATVPNLNGMAIFDEQGTGKTVVALCTYDRLRQKHLIDRLLIIAPKSVIGGWRTDVKKLFGEFYRFMIISGHAKTRRREILGHSNDIIALSYETAVSEVSLISTLVSAPKTRYLLVVDESYYVKNPDARRTRAVMQIRKGCDRALVLCGTPAPNRPHDLVEQVNVADGGIAFGECTIPPDTANAFPIIAKALKNAVYLRRLKHDVMPDLAEKEIEQVSFSLQPVQQTLYQYALNDLILKVSNTDDAQFTRQLSSFFALRLALLQLCSHPKGIDPLYSETPAKQLVLDQMLRELIDRTNQKVVIWSYFRYSLNSLANRYAHYGLARIDGSITDVEQRIEAIRSFQDDPETRIFLGNAAAAGAGITLTSAHHAIYESFSNQAAHYMQSVDRIHRRGQEYNVIIHVLLANQTIEEQEFNRIRGKEQIGRDLLGDNYKEPMTRKRFLEELGGQHV